MSATEEHLPTEKFTVPANAELRVEVGSAKCYITITSGCAEVFGAVLQSHRRIELQDTKIAIFSFEGCSIVLEGFPCEPACVFKPCAMHSVLPAHRTVHGSCTSMFTCNTCCVHSHRP